MLVDVVRLRFRGRKIDRESARSAVPVRGSLQIETCRALLTPEHRVTPRVALLVRPGIAESALPPLLFARVGRLRNWQLVVIGNEDVGDSRRPTAAGPIQAWWCRVVRDPPGGAPNACALDTAGQRPGHLAGVASAEEPSALSPAELVTSD